MTRSAVGAQGSRQPHSASAESGQDHANRLRTISGSNTGFNNGPIGIALDTTRDSYLVTNPFYDAAFHPAVLEFPRTASGNVFPTRAWGGATSGMAGPNGLAIDAESEEILVANSIGNSITVYSKFLTGAITPQRTISGAGTQLGSPQFIVVLGGSLFADGFDPAP